MNSKRMTYRIGLMMAVLIAAAEATTITVTSTGDSGGGSLRAALASATDGDTINFAVAAPATITLTSGELLVTNNLTILGPGPANLVVNGNAASRVFHIGSNAVVTISGMEIFDGLATYPVASGGGIYNDHATLTVSNSILSGNSASSGGGISNDGGELGRATLTIVNSILVGNSASLGGGVDNTGAFSGRATLIVKNSTIKFNLADAFGGGIENDAHRFGSATLLIANSSISGNSSDDDAGGIHNGAFGSGSATLLIVNSTISDNSATEDIGGIWNDGRGSGSAMLTITNSTISGNSAPVGGGGILNDGRPFGAGSGSATLLIVNSTISSNSATDGGGIDNAGLGGNATVEIGSTILNAGASGANITNDSGTVTSDGYNLSSDDGGGFLTVTGDQINTDPMLGPLQDNGGPTFTHALLPGSPAFDAGDPNFTPPPDFDQRGPGFLRVVNGRIDIGAFEVQAPADSDGDGVPDAIDQCPDTEPGVIVDATGCSIAQLVPCDGLRSGGTWKSHGQYVAAVVHAATDFLKAKLITRRQWVETVTHAARSKCGWNRRRDHDGDRDWHRDWDCSHDADWERGRDWDRD